VRIDKWLWAVRLYKTRTAATEACSGGHVEVGGVKAKAARKVAVGEEVELSGHARVRRCRVVRLVEKRVGAAVAAECVEVVEAVASVGSGGADGGDGGRPWWMEAGPVGARERGAGRPTKRERRLTDRLRGQ